MGGVGTEDVDFRCQSPVSSEFDHITSTVVDSGGSVEDLITRIEGFGGRVVEVIDF